MIASGVICLLLRNYLTHPGLHVAGSTLLLDVVGIRQLLLNVLKGQMSLVGPRPPLPSEVCQYKSWQRRRLSVRPGITCLWQIRGRNEIDFDKWMELDLLYIDQWSYMRDWWIMLQTIPAVLRRQGAR